MLVVKMSINFSWMSSIILMYNLFVLLNQIIPTPNTYHQKNLVAVRSEAIGASLLPAPMILRDIF